MQNRYSMKKSQQNKMALFGKEQMEKYTGGALKPWTVPFTIYGCLYMLGYLCSKGYSNSSFEALHTNKNNLK